HPRLTLFPYTTLFRSLNFEGNLQDFTQFSYVDFLIYKDLLSDETGYAAKPEYQGYLQIARQIREKTRDKIVLAGVTFTGGTDVGDRKSTRLNSSHLVI